MLLPCKLINSFIFFKFYLSLLGGAGGICAKLHVSMSEDNLWNQFSPFSFIWVPGTNQSSGWPWGGGEGMHLSPLSHLAGPCANMVRDALEVTMRTWSWHTCDFTISRPINCPAGIYVVVLTLDKLNIQYWPVRWCSVIELQESYSHAFLQWELSSEVTESELGNCSHAHVSREMSKGRSEGSEIGNMYCSCKWPELCSQHTHQL